MLHRPAACRRVEAGGLFSGEGRSPPVQAPDYSAGEKVMIHAADKDNYLARKMEESIYGKESVIFDFRNAVSVERIERLRKHGPEIDNRPYCHRGKYRNDHGSESSGGYSLRRRGRNRGRPMPFPGCWKGKPSWLSPTGCARSRQRTRSLFWQMGKLPRKAVLQSCWQK